MTNPSWPLILGVLAPLITALVQQPKWSSNVRRAVAVAVAVVLGALASYVDGTLSLNGDLLGAVATVLIASQATYNTLWRHAAPALEAATSPRARVVQQTDVEPVAVQTAPTVVVPGPEPVVVNVSDGPGDPDPEPVRRPRRARPSPRGTRRE